MAWTYLEERAATPATCVDMCGCQTIHLALIDLACYFLEVGLKNRRIDCQSPISITGTVVIGRFRGSLDHVSSREDCSSMIDLLSLPCFWPAYPACLTMTGSLGRDVGRR